MTFFAVMLDIFGITMAMATRGSEARVVSGQTVCLDGLERSCYKIAYFHDVSSRIAFWEAFQACEMDGGSLLSIESLTEQKDIENLLQTIQRQKLDNHTAPHPMSEVDSGAPHPVSEVDSGAPHPCVEVDSGAPHPRV
ncbi:chondrolectin-like [Thalassophryne amazonica]|uniref:chondrolectin-like n=1 Tax=Thalassophryne amazonica TaxID=390379 RepID=UPI0014715066|nr:chondrolectin-like [Thalassophryne amazonica]